MFSIAEGVRRQAALEDLARRERMRRAWTAYHGNAPKCLKHTPGQPDDNVQANYARVVVDQGVSFLFGGGVDIRVGADAPPGAQKWLDAAWLHNDRDTLLHRLAMNGAVCGHAFVKLTRAKAAEGERSPGYPRIVVLDPLTVSVRWQPDDWESVVRYDVEWNGLDPISGGAAAFRQTMTRRQDGQPGWTITDQRSDGDDVRWQTVRHEAWPYAWAPVAGCQNLPAPNEFWGTSDLEPDVLDLCRAMSFVLSNAARILRLHAHPRLWGSGFHADDLSLGPEDVTILPVRDAQLHLLEMQGDLSSSLELYRRVKDALHELTRVPEISAGALNALGRVSGVALRVLYQPLMEKTRTKRMLYGALIREVSRRMLAMGGFGEDVHIELEWPAVAPTDPYEEAQTSVLYTQLGMSGEAALRRLGLVLRDSPDEQTREAGRGDTTKGRQEERP